MGAPYVSQSSSGYNDNPPADDGSQVSSNRINWSTIKTKLSDVVKTLAENINSAVSTAFGKIVGGAGVTTTATSYQVLSADQGKLVNITASGQTITTPSATDVSSPFVFGVLNNSSGACTIDGSGSQTVNGAASISLAAGQGVLLWTDGSNWFAIGGIGSAASLSIAAMTLSGALSAATVAGAMVASQAQMEAASAVDVVVVPGRQHFHPSACKGWARFNASGTITSDYNVLSVTDNATGSWTVNWETDFAGAGDYSCLATIGEAGTETLNVSVDDAAAGTTTLDAETLAGAAADPDSPAAIFVAAFGDHA